MTSVTGDEPGASCGGVESHIRDDGTMVLRVFGEIDPSNAGEITRALDDLGVSAPLIDLTEVTFMDSSGISALVTIKEQGPEATRFLVAAGSQVDRLMSLVGLREHLGVIVE